MRTVLVSILLTISALAQDRPQQKDSAIPLELRYSYVKAAAEVMSLTTPELNRAQAAKQSAVAAMQKVCGSMKKVLGTNQETGEPDCLAPIEPKKP